MTPGQFALTAPSVTWGHGHELTNIITSYTGLENVRVTIGETADYDLLNFYFSIKLFSRS